MSKSRADYSLFTKVTGLVITVILVCVDDLLIAGNSEEHINMLKAVLSQTFHMKDLEEVKYFLGLEYIDQQLVSLFHKGNMYLTC